MAKLSEQDIARALQANSKRAPTPISDINIEVSLDELDSFGDKESIKEMYESVASYNRMLGEKITFINKALTAAVPFTRENLLLRLIFRIRSGKRVKRRLLYQTKNQSRI
jgi:hypothetical protein